MPPEGVVVAPVALRGMGGPRSGLLGPPQDTDAADCCGEGGSIEDARSDGHLRRQYADLWAAHLQETGCTYTDIEC